MFGQWTERKEMEIELLIKSPNYLIFGHIIITIIFPLSSLYQFSLVGERKRFEKRKSFPLETVQKVFDCPGDLLIK